METNRNDNFIMKPKVDYCFKELMEDEEVRMAFLAAALDISMKEIISTTLMPTHLRKTFQEEKLGILDVRVLMKDKTQVDIEIQIAPLYTEGKEGDDYKKLEKCIHIGVLDFELFHCQVYSSVFHLWEDERREKYSDKLEVHILELPKLKRYQYPETELLHWARFLGGESREELEMAAEKSPYIEKAYKNLEKLSADEMKRYEYQAREKAIRDHNYFTKLIEEGKEIERKMKERKQKGMEEGMEEGRREGIEEGRREGIEKGRREGIEKGRREGIEEGREQERGEMKQELSVLLARCQEEGLSAEEALLRIQKSFIEK